MTPPDGDMTAQYRIEQLEKTVNELRTYKVSRREFDGLVADFEELRNDMRQKVTREEAKQLSDAVSALSGEFRALRTTITNAAIGFAFSAVLFAITIVVGASMVIPR